MKRNEKKIISKPCWWTSYEICLFTHHLCLLLLHIKITNAANFKTFLKSFIKRLATMMRAYVFDKIHLFNRWKNKREKYDAYKMANKHHMTINVIFQWVFFLLFVRRNFSMNFIIIKIARIIFLLEWSYRV